LSIESKKPGYLKAWKAKAAPFAALADPRNTEAELEFIRHVEGFRAISLNVKRWILFIMASLVPVMSWEMLPAARSAQSGK